MQQPETQAISLLKVRASTLEEILHEYEKRFKTAPKNNPETKYLSAEQDFATRLADMKREAVSAIKKIEARKIQALGLEIVQRQMDIEARRA